MKKEICKNLLVLGCKAQPAGIEDMATAKDLMETFAAHRDTCVGMAANMIGVPKAIIIFDAGTEACLMLNPRILSQSEPYETEEGCLSLTGVRKTVRYRRIKVSWQDLAMKMHTATYTDFTAQIIQHEIDHLKGIII